MERERLQALEEEAVAKERLLESDQTIQNLDKVSTGAWRMGTGLYLARDM